MRRVSFFMAYIHSLRGHLFELPHGRNKWASTRKMTVQLRRPDTTASWVEARRLVEEYASSLNLDLSFQNFANEIEQLSTEYGPPKGAFLLAKENGRLVGCIGLRESSETTGEVKRLYVVPTARGCGAGRAWLRESCGPPE
ncbi:MAG: GNAT family N-acetyltransferase [Gemmatimonadaceae bacterium]